MYLLNIINSITIIRKKFREDCWYLFMCKYHSVKDFICRNIEKWYGFAIDK